MRNNTTRITLIALLMSSFVLAVAAPDAGVNVTVRVFKISRAQSWEAEFPYGCGGITKIRVNGDVTAAFPKGIVFLHTELSHKASYSTIINVIRDRISFGSGTLIAKRVYVEYYQKT